MTKIRYKVVKTEEELKSSHAKGELCVTYSTAKWATAPIGGLFVFRLLCHARSFAGLGEKVFECEVKEPVKLPGERLTEPRQLLRAFLAWRRRKQRYERVWPTGSEAYRLVKLIREI